MFERWLKRRTGVPGEKEGKTEEKNPEVQVITCWEGANGGSYVSGGQVRDFMPFSPRLADKKAFYTPGALVRVKNGKGQLYERFSEETGDVSYCTLMFGDVPLFQFQGDEYYCPTCEKIVRSGYGPKQPQEFREARMNGENVSFEEALEGMKPLLGLLEDNCYVILDTQLYPTDGNGHLFWDVPASEGGVPGSCLFYRGEGEWGNLRPHFTVATQSGARLCESRVEYYREHPGCRAVAYYMDGYMTALLDGHHKALAAALERRKVNALVIIPCYPVAAYQNGIRAAEYLRAGDMSFSCAQYGVKAAETYKDKLSAEKMEIIQAWFTGREPCFPYDSRGLAAIYPDARGVSDLEAYTDKYGEITPERLDRIVAQTHICTPDEICDLMAALGALRHERLFETADFFLRKCTYLSLLAFHDTDTFKAIAKQLMKLPHSEEIVQYMVEIMVEYEDEYPSVGEEIKEWL